MFGRKSTDIAGYTFGTENFCPRCIILALPTHPGGAFDGWALAPGVRVTTEDNLTEIAHAFNINRNDERTYDSAEFPKVIFDDSVQDDERCATCHELLSDS